ncbi:MAG: hypothetical protein JKY56_20725, partial [Kofleriaceae bacterium]|nr:hypothetical protein [Kofleriaceae bacterium]
MSDFGKSSGQHLEIMITVDVESWPRLNDWRETALAGDLARDIYGATPDGDFGIGYQVALLQKHGLKGVFFVEALFACEVGIEPLKAIVDCIQDAGSEVQLHIHTEWFEKMSEPLLPERAYNIRELSKEGQVRVISTAIENLRNAGVSEVNAYRAGNFGADFTTLEALAECGIRYDSSYNYSYLDKGCGLEMSEMLVQPKALEHLLEYPVSCFRDYPGHYRPAQLCAVSAAEMQSAMLAAYDARWHNFVIVSHSFELLRERKNALPHGQADWPVIRRFEELCRHLEEHSDRYRTVGFHEVAPLPEIARNYEPLHMPIPA